MARPRKPTAELELKGAFKKDPQRKRVDPKTSGPVGNPPPSLDMDIHATWYELAEQAPIDVLRSADRALLGIAATLLYKIRKTPLDKLEPAMIGQLLKCLSAMGMTPADRSKVHAPKEKAENKFAKFASKAAEARKPVH